MELMSERQWKRWDAVGRINAGKLTMSEAARICGFSVRQLRRIRRRVAEIGRGALVHGNAGRPARNRIAAPIRERVLELRRGSTSDSTISTSARSFVRRSRRSSCRCERFGGFSAKPVFRR
jgi:hypothetical protein